MKADIHTSELERKHGGSGQEVFKVFLWFRLAQQFADIGPWMITSAIGEMLEDRLDSLSLNNLIVLRADRTDDGIIHSTGEHAVEQEA